VPAGTFPIFSSQGRILACALGLSFRFFQALACSSQLIFREPYPLPGHVSLQLGTVDDFRRFGLAGGRVICGSCFGSGFFHGSRTKRAVSLARPAAACHRALHRIRDTELSTEFVHNHVDRPLQLAQRGNAAKGLRWTDYSFAMLEWRALIRSL